IEPEAKLFGSRKDRGWGEVANASYGSFLDVLQTALYRDKPTKKGETLSATYQQLLDVPLGLEYGPDSLDEEYLEVIRLYQFPVHVVGYNWLGSNMLSAIRLQEQIKKIVGGYQKRGMKCHKVILVTHSMGGLVARYFSECLSGNTDVYGIVHGVLPSIGAAATYTRMKRGTENPESNPEGYVISHILGRNAAEMVAVFSQSPGPMELLPMNDYGEEWLNIVDRDGSTLTLPKNLPIKEGIAPEERTYAELYLNRENWWMRIY
ncbi:esterase/lipase family protein, partial [Escherichia coli]